MGAKAPEAVRMWEWLTSREAETGQDVRLRARFAGDADAQNPITIVLSDGIPRAELPPQTRALFDQIDPDEIAAKNPSSDDARIWRARFDKVRDRELLSLSDVCRLLLGPRHRPNRTVYAFNANVELRVDPRDAARWFDDVSTEDPAWPSLSDLMQAFRDPDETGDDGEDLDQDEEEVAPERPRFWVEKTIVKGRADREAGEHALGKALWSPTRSKAGADIYAEMREVRPGDVVFHLIDNRHVSGVSVAVHAASDDFAGIEGTSWSGDCYRIPLRDYQPLSPPLDRDDFLAADNYRAALLQLNQKHKVFYNKGLQFNQGFYLTEAPRELIRIWSEIYGATAGTTLPHVGVLDAPQVADAVPEPTADLTAICSHFADKLKASNISFGDDHEPFVRTFVASLATKGFVILTGLSGSGKTQIARCFGHWLGGRYSVVPVRPDWTGSESLFGYEDALQPPDKHGRRPWTVPRALEVMLTAAREPIWPRVLVLDEMNLAHVERYFADVLSGMESAEPCLPNLEREPDGAWRVPVGQAQRIPFPRNLFIVGTVNVDETTYLFSPKVLDRANTIEFRVRTSDLRDDYQKPGRVEHGPDELIRGFLTVAQDDSWQADHPMADKSGIMKQLRTLHQLLAADGFEFGHRVVYEALRFGAMLSSSGANSTTEALDLQVLQKVLPRIHGSRRRLERPLRALSKYCLDLSPRDETSERYEPDVETATPALPKSFDKVRRMLNALRINQFTSFTE